MCSSEWIESAPRPQISSNAQALTTWRKWSCPKGSGFRVQTLIKIKVEDLPGCQSHLGFHDKQRNIVVHLADLQGFREEFELLSADFVMHVKNNVLPKCWDVKFINLHSKEKLFQKAYGLDNGEVLRAVLDVDLFSIFYVAQSLMPCIEVPQDFAGQLTCKITVSPIQLQPLSEASNGVWLIDGTLLARQKQYLSELVVQAYHILHLKQLRTPLGTKESIILRGSCYGLRPAEGRGFYLFLAEFTVGRFVEVGRHMRSDQEGDLLVKHGHREGFSECLVSGIYQVKWPLRMRLRPDPGELLRLLKIQI